MNETDKTAAERLGLNPAERDTRRDMIYRLLNEDVALVEQISIDLHTLSTGRVAAADRIRAAIFRAHDAAPSVSLPMNYRVLGGTSKTPHYLQRGSERVSDAELLTDALTGLMSDYAARLQAHYDSRAKRDRPKLVMPTDTEMTGTEINVSLDTQSGPIVPCDACPRPFNCAFEVCVPVAVHAAPNVSAAQERK